MIDLAPGELLGPGGLLRLYDAGYTREQAFDLMAAQAASPAFHAEIARFESLQVGRELLADVRRYWESEGLPCPWDNVLELTRV